MGDFVLDCCLLLVVEFGVDSLLSLWQYTRKVKVNEAGFWSEGSIVNFTSSGIGCVFSLGVGFNCNN